MKGLPQRTGAALLACVLAVPAARAAEDVAPPAFKLTLGRYASSDGNPAIDANLRGSLGAHTGWIGVYRDREGLTQWRSGYEFRTDGEWLRSVSSLQNASGGAWVGSLGAEVGGDTYAIVGFGRTNLRPYVNLNFDPNDAVTLGVGTRALAGHELSLFAVRDDRLHTGQQVTHAVWRWRFEGEQRLTLDLFAKRGLAADGMQIDDRSWSVGYDRGAWFARYAHDPHAGFGAADQQRVSIGTRF